MNREQAEDYTESLGQIFEGSWRQVAWANRQGIPKALGLTVKEWVTQRLGGRIRLAAEERKAAVEELRAQGLSYDKIAEILGIGRETIGEDLGTRAPRDHHQRVKQEKPAFGRPFITPQQIEAAQTQEVQAEERRAADPVTQSYQQGTALLSLGSAIARFCMEVRSAFPQLGTCPEVERFWLVRDLERLEAATELIRTYLHSGDTTVTQQIAEILGGSTHE